MSRLNWIGEWQARAARIMAMGGSGVTSTEHLVAFDYLPAGIQGELRWLQGFAGSMRSSQAERR